MSRKLTAWSVSIVSGSDPSRILLFLDDGGYCSGSILSHRRLVGEAGRAAGMCTLAIAYRLGNGLRLNLEEYGQFSLGCKRRSRGGRQCYPNDFQGCSPSFWRCSDQSSQPNTL